MTTPTVAVTVRFVDDDGPIVGLVVSARMDKNDEYTSVQVIASVVRAVTDANGDAVLNLFPNELAPTGLGTTGSVWRFKARPSTGNLWSYAARVPNSACNLSDLANISAVSAGTPLASAVRTTQLTGLSVASADDITSADTVLSAAGKLQGKFNILASSGVAFDGGTVQTVLDDAKPMQSYAALRAYTGRSTGVRITQQGVSGFFARSLTDATSADDGGTIIVDGSGRRWLRLYSGEVNVKWFGALGDGLTDDAAAFVAAKATGQAIYAPAGTYVVSPIVFTFIVFGDGCEKTIFKAKSGSTGFLVSLQSTSGQFATKFSDIGLTANGAGQSGLKFITSTGKAERLKLIGFDTQGISFGDGTTGAYWCRASECFLTMAGGTGVTFAGGAVNANANECQNVFVSGTFGRGVDFGGIGNLWNGGTVEWQAGCIDVMRFTGSSNIVDGAYVEAVAGAQPTNLFNFSGNNNKVRSLQLQASLSNSLYSHITDTGRGNEVHAAKSLRFSSALSQSNKNYIPNASFAEWVGTNQPYGFVNIGAGGVRDATTTYAGNASLKLTIAGSFLQGQCYLLPNALSATNYPVEAFQGRTVSLSVLCRTALAGYGGLAYTILAPSGNINGNSSCSHTGGAAWELFTDTFRIPDDATQLIVLLKSHPDGTVGTGDVWFSAPAITFGAEAVPFADVLPNANDIAFTHTTSFTPVVTGATIAGAGTYSRQFGRYQRIGSRVFFEITLVWTAHTGTGDLTITGLPYTSINISAFHSPPVALYATGLPYGAGKQLMAFVTANSNSISVFAVDPAGGATATVAMDGSASLYLSGHYEIA